MQAFCDLSLPSYTSDIINVGIQQKGIEDGVPEQIDAQSFERLLLFLDEGQQEQVKADYREAGDAWYLQEISKEERQELNDILGKAEVALVTLTQSEETTAAIKAQMNLPEDADLFETIAALPSQVREQMLAGVSGQMEQMPDSIITQMAVSFVQSEYDTLGEDTDAMQMRYLLFTGLKMLALAFLGMVAAISVTFLSARVAAVTGHDLRAVVYRKVIGFSNAEFNRFSTASLITRSTNDIQQVQLLMAMFFRIACYAPILGIGGVLKVLRTDVSMSWIIGLAVVLIMLVVLVLFKVAMPRFKTLQVLIDRLNLVTREILTGIPVIRAFSREKYEEERFEEANRNLMKTNLFVNRCMTFMMPVMMLVMNGVSVLIVYNGAHAIDGGSMQVGDMMAFIQYAMQIIMSFDADDAFYHAAESQRFRKAYQ